MIYRGKRKDNGELVKGWLLKTAGHRYIIKDGLYDADIVVGFSKNCPSVQGCYRVIPESVAMETGVKDKNGKMIFQHDITDDGVVVWLQSRCAWVLKEIDEDNQELFVQLSDIVASCIEIIK